DGVEGAEQVDGHDLPEGVEVVCRLIAAVAADRALRPADDRRVDQHAQRTELLGRVHSGDDLCGVGDVDLHEPAPHLVGEPATLVLLEVGDHDGRSSGREETYDGRNDPRSPTCHDCACTCDVHGRH